MKEEMSRRLALFEVGAYYTATHFPSITVFSPAPFIRYSSQHPLLIISFATLTTRFAALTETLT